jgi:hypothetical protein
MIVHAMENANFFLNGQLFAGKTCFFGLRPGCHAK